MESKEIIKQKIDFIKTEYQQLHAHLDFLEDSEWKIRQLSITLWLASAGVGLGLQGFTTNNFYILLVSALIPFLFLYMDARVGRWTSGHKARLKQIELFLSNPNYVLPNAGGRISFPEFASDIGKSSVFPVLDFGGKVTCGDDPQYIIDTGATFPHMTIGLRRIFYQTQIAAGLILLSIQLYDLYKSVWVFLIIALSPIFHGFLVLFKSVRERRIRKKFKEGSQNSGTAQHSVQQLS